MTLQEIRKPIATELMKVEIEFQEALKSNVNLIDEIVTHIVAHKGKRLRPILLLLCSGMAGAITNETIKAAAIVELLHTATLVHDDVVDDAELRRGGPSVNSLWNNKTTILMGDFIFSSVLHNLSGLQNLRMISVISAVAKRMSQGELIQLEYGHDHNIEETTYFKLISEKTASLLSATCELGALTSIGLSKEINDAQVEALSKFGEYLGIAFQIRDDLLDFTGDASAMGKPIANDLIENIVTLPLLYALKQADNHHLDNVLMILERGVDKSDIGELVSFVNQYGGLDYASDKAREYKDKALQQLDIFDNSEYKNCLISLTDFITAREH